jgi:hypothetical protein
VQTQLARAPDVVVLAAAAFSSFTSLQEQKQKQRARTPNAAFILEYSNLFRDITLAGWMAPLL